MPSLPAHQSTQPSRPLGITLLSIGIVLLSGVAALIGYGYLRAVIEYGSAFPTAFDAVEAVLLFYVALYGVIAGLGALAVLWLWVGNPWGRYLGLSWFALAFVDTVSGQVLSRYGPEPVQEVFGHTITSFVVSATIIFVGTLYLYSSEINYGEATEESDREEDSPLPFWMS